MELCVPHRLGKQGHWDKSGCRDIPGTVDRTRLTPCGVIFLLKVTKTVTRGHGFLERTLKCFIHTLSTKS